MTENLRAEILIRTWTAHMRFGLDGSKSVDWRGWAQAADRLGFGAVWAFEWISAGWPDPPEWTWFGIVSDGAD
jgi:hypothetical protein